VKSNLFLKTALALAIATPLAAMAESSVVNNPTSGSAAQARLDLRVTIPQFISLTVGSNSATIDEVAFALTPDQAVTPGTVAATANGTVAVALSANVGDLDFSAATSTANLVDTTTGATLPLAAISVDSSAGALAHPTFNAAAVSIPATNGVINTTGSWTFAYNHLTTQVPGDFTTQVTYTAALP
jgi:hypothetical protein